jgi:20S proteasome alpha/beta subunit
VTVVLALRYKGGLLLASDSQSTAGTQGQPSKGDAKKLFVLGGIIGWGGSGSTGLIQRVRDELDRDATAICGSLKKHPAGVGSEHIFKIVNKHQQQALKDHVPATGVDPAETMGAIFVGFDGAGSPFIFEIGTGGQRGFHPQPYDAIGSADIFAWHAIRSVENYYNLPELNRDLAMALAYRTIDNAIRTAAHYIGPPVQLLEVTPTDARILDATQIKAIEDIVDLWRSKEVKTLTTLLEPEAPAIPVEEPAREGT